MRNESLPQTGAFVLNLDKKEGPGTHWVAVYLNEYYDAYGLPPPECLAHMKKYNIIQHQRPSTALCGLYAIYFIYHRNRGCSAYDIWYKMLKPKTNRNELYKFYKDILCKMPTQNGYSGS